MSRDPLVAEVRAIREAYAKRFNYDLQVICRDLKEQETKSGRKIVSLPPRRAEIVHIRMERMEMIPGATLCVACQSAKELEPARVHLGDTECPRCAQKGIKSRLVWRTRRDQSTAAGFLGCSRFPACRYTE
jgi:hypothetical protein